MNKIVFFPGMLLLSLFASAQTNCGTAIQQLQNYAANVNQMYQKEYWQVIPNLRCPAIDQIGRPVHPQLVQNCRLTWLTSLNAWYMQECRNVNTWYVQIAQGCAINSGGDSQDDRRRPAPRTTQKTDEELSEIDTDEIEDLTGEVDEDKVVRIRIPKTPQGFRR